MGWGSWGGFKLQIGTAHYFSSVPDDCASVQPTFPVSFFFCVSLHLPSFFFLFFFIPQSCFVYTNRRSNGDDITASLSIPTLYYGLPTLVFLLADKQSLALVVYIIHYIAIYYSICLCVYIYI